MKGFVQSSRREIGFGYDKVPGHPIVQARIPKPRPRGICVLPQTVDGDVDADQAVHHVHRRKTIESPTEVLPP